MTAPSDFNSIPELDATLVFRVAYDGSSYSGFAEQPGQTTVAGELRRSFCTIRSSPPSKSDRSDVRGSHRCRRACRGSVHQRARNGR